MSAVHKTIGINNFFFFTLALIGSMNLFPQTVCLMAQGNYTDNPYSLLFGLQQKKQKRSIVPSKKRKVNASKPKKKIIKKLFAPWRRILLINICFSGLLLTAHHRKKEEFIDSVYRQQDIQEMIPQKTISKIFKNAIETDDSEVLRAFLDNKESRDTLGLNNKNTSEFFEIAIDNYAIRGVTLLLKNKYTRDKIKDEAISKAFDHVISFNDSSLLQVLLEDEKIKKEVPLDHKRISEFFKDAVSSNDFVMVLILLDNESIRKKIDKKTVLDVFQDAILLYKPHLLKVLLEKPYSKEIIGSVHSKTKRKLFKCLLQEGDIWDTSVHNQIVRTLVKLIKIAEENNVELKIDTKKIKPLLKKREEKELLEEYTESDREKFAQETAEIALAYQRVDESLLKFQREIIFKFYHLLEFVKGNNIKLDISRKIPTILTSLWIYNPATTKTIIEAYNTTQKTILQFLKENDKEKLKALEEEAKTIYKKQMYPKVKNIYEGNNRYKEHHPCDGEKAVKVASTLSLLLEHFSDQIGESMIKKACEIKLKTMIHHGVDKKPIDPFLLESITEVLIEKSTFHPDQDKDSFVDKNKDNFLKNEKDTLLCFSIRKGRQAALTLLKSPYINPNDRDHNNKSPLQLAIEKYNKTKGHSYPICQASTFYNHTSINIKNMHKSYKIEYGERMYRKIIQALLCHPKINKDSDEYKEAQTIIHQKNTDSYGDLFTQREEKTCAFGKCKAKSVSTKKSDLESASDRDEFTTPSEEAFESYLDVD